MPTLPLIDLVPPPMTVRHLIGVRAAELSLLRRLLKVSESQAVLRARVEDAATQPLVTPHAPTQEPAHAAR